MDILVEAMGRMNFGKGIYDWKGITEKVEIQSDGAATSLKNWKVYNIPVDYAFAKNKKFVKQDNPKKPLRIIVEHLRWIKPVILSWI